MSVHFFPCTCAEDDILPFMEERGFQGLFVAKPESPCLVMGDGFPPDGCALLWRKDRFSLRESRMLSLPLTPQDSVSNQVRPLPRESFHSDVVVVVS